MLKTSYVALCGLGLALAVACDSTSYGLQSGTGGSAGEIVTDDGGSPAETGGAMGTGGDITSDDGGDTGGGGAGSDASVIADAGADVPSADPPDVAALQDASWLDGKKGLWDLAGLARIRTQAFTGDFKPAYDAAIARAEAALSQAAVSVMDKGRTP